MKNLNPAKKLLNTIEIFSSFTSLKPNLSKRETSLIGALKEITVAVCGIKCIDFTKECFKITVFIIHIIRKILKNKKKRKVLKMWRLRNLTLDRKSTVFKYIALSIIIFSTGFANFETRYF